MRRGVADERPAAPIERDPHRREPRAGLRDHDAATRHHDLIRPHVHERHRKRQAERRHGRVVEPDEDRNPAYDAVGIDRGKRVADGSGVLREPGQRPREGQRRRQRQRHPRTRQPGSVGRQMPIEWRRAGELERDRIDDGVRQGGRLAQQRVARRATAAWRARLPERDIETDGGGAGAGKTRDESGEDRPVPGTRTESGLARRVAGDDQQRGADGRRRARANPAIIDRPLERRGARATEGGHTQCQEGRREPDHRGHECVAGNRGAPDDRGAPNGRARADPRRPRG